MKITKEQLKKLIEQELKEVDFGLTSPMDARIQAARAKKKKEREEFLMFCAYCALAISLIGLITLLLMNINLFKN